MSRFSTKINANGPNGNIFSILGAATSMMRQMKIDNTIIDLLRKDVMSAGNYEEALAFIEEWFPIEREVA